MSAAVVDLNERQRAPTANWSPLEHMPIDEVLSKLIDTAERRWTAERFARNHDVRALTNWLWGCAA